MESYVAQRSKAGSILSLILSVFFIGIALVFILSGGMDSETLLFVSIFGIVGVVVGIFSIINLLNNSPIAILERGFLEVFSDSGKESVKYRLDTIERFDRHMEVKIGRDDKKRTSDHLYIVLKNDAGGHFVSGVEKIDLDTVKNKTGFLMAISQTGIPVKRTSNLSNLTEVVSTVMNRGGFKRD